MEGEYLTKRLGWDPVLPKVPGQNNNYNFQHFYTLTNWSRTGEELRHYPNLHPDVMYRFTELVGNDGNRRLNDMTLEEVEAYCSRRTLSTECMASTTRGPSEKKQDLIKVLNEAYSVMGDDLWTTIYQPWIYIHTFKRLESRLKPTDKDGGKDGGPLKWRFLKNDFESVLKSIAQMNPLDDNMFWKMYRQGKNASKERAFKLLHAGNVDLSSVAFAEAETVTECYNDVKIIEAISVIRVYIRASMKSQKYPVHIMYDKDGNILDKHLSDCGCVLGLNACSHKLTAYLMQSIMYAVYNKKWDGYKKPKTLDDLQGMMPNDANDTFGMAVPLTLVIDNPNAPFGQNNLDLNVTSAGTDDNENEYDYNQITKKICMEYISKDREQDTKMTLKPVNLQEQSMKCLNTGPNINKRKYLESLQFHDRLLQQLTKKGVPCGMLGTYLKESKRKRARLTCYLQFENEVFKTDEWEDAKSEANNTCTHLGKIDGTCWILGDKGFAAGRADYPNGNLVCVPAGPGNGVEKKVSVRARDTSERITFARGAVETVFSRQTNAGRNFLGRTIGSPYLNYAQDAMHWCYGMQNLHEPLKKIRKKEGDEV